jgi:hypothetical protein
MSLIFNPERVFESSHEIRRSLQNISPALHLPLRRRMPKTHRREFPLGLRKRQGPHFETDYRGKRSNNAVAWRIPLIRMATG